MSEEQEQPLLENYGVGAVHPDCPGCRAAHLRHKNAPIPFRLLFHLGLVILANVLPISVVYPFLYFMIQDLNVTKREEDIGFYAGWIGSSLMVGRMLTGVLWGVVADRYGRKKVMICGILSVIVFNTLFGLSTSFWMALVMRFLLGCFNGVLGTVKAYASEICSEQNQAVSMSVVGTTWGFGLIIGPAIGGYLAQPAIKYPNLFKSGSLFEKFPYLLQALGVLVIALIALILSFYLPETVHKNHGPVFEASKEDKDCHNNYMAITVDSTKEFEEKLQKSESIFKNRSFISSTMVYCIWSLHDTAYTEIFSLWAISDRSYGGLSFTSSDVGQVIAISGLIILVFQLTMFPLLARWLGPILVTRGSALLTLPILTAYPFFSRLHGSSLWGILLPACICKLILAETTFTGSFILINNSVKQSQRGAANGFSLSLVSLFMAIGPAGGGSIFAWSQTRQDAGFLPGDHLVFFFLNVFVLLTALATCKPFLPPSTAKPMDE